MSSFPWRLYGSVSFLLLTLSVLVTGGCTPSSKMPSNTTDVSSAENAAKSAVVKLEFPDGDSSVPAEKGGPGFTGEGWETSNPGPIGDPRAIKGGGGFFPTFRIGQRICEFTERVPTLI